MLERARGEHPFGPSVELLGGSALDPLLSLRGHAPEAQSELLQRDLGAPSPQASLQALRAPLLTPVLTPLLFPSLAQTHG